MDEWISRAKAVIRIVLIYEFLRMLALRFVGGAGIIGSLLAVLGVAYLEDDDRRNWASLLLSVMVTEARTGCGPPPSGGGGLAAAAGDVVSLMVLRLKWRRGCSYVSCILVVDDSLRFEEGVRDELALVQGCTMSLVGIRDSLYLATYCKGAIRV